MAFVLSEVKLPHEKPLWTALSYAFGIGQGRSTYICTLFGFGPNYRMESLNHYL
jgi:ribosomal protein S13